MIPRGDYHLHLLSTSAVKQLATVGISEQVRDGAALVAQMDAADAVTSRDRPVQRVYFDVAAVALGQSAPVLARFASRMRQVGLERILFGTDVGAPRDAWNTLASSVPLSGEEVAQICWKRHLVPSVIHPCCTSRYPR